MEADEVVSQMRQRVESYAELYPYVALSNAAADLVRQADALGAALVAEWESEKAANTAADAVAAPLAGHGWSLGDPSPCHNRPLVRTNATDRVKCPLCYAQFELAKASEPAAL